MPESQVHLLAVSVGNSTTRFARFEGSEMLTSERISNEDPAKLIDAVVAAAKQMPDVEDPSAIILASTNEPVASRIAAALKQRTDDDVYRLGTDLEIPIQTALLQGATPGQDRLLNALAAFDRMKRACVIVDCGTAVTVDFVDGRGVFQGGAIAPGASMALHALHERTAALPLVHLERPDPADPFGRDTKQAMLNGVYWGIRGLVRILTERYAEAYEAYPPVIVTGGDAALIFEHDELIDRIIPELTLMGIQTVCKLLLSDEDQPEIDQG